MGSAEVESMRDAASVVPCRVRNGTIWVYMMRRRGSLKAFPGVWAFPGGSVEAEDQSAPLPSVPDAERLTAWFADVETSPLQVAQAPFMAWAAPWFVRRLGYVPHDTWPAVDADPAANRAAVAAALRELTEETGGQAERTSSEAAHGLRYLGRLVTPPHERVRFNCRFFVWEASGTLHWPEAEATEGRWVETADVAARDDDLFPMALPTRYIIERLAAVGPAGLSRWTVSAEVGTND
jgi:8-oxo-dGTP pyrophosphatase MutT (NUDIX family)